MFKKSDNGRERTNLPSRMIPGEGAISIIGPGMHIQGDISTDGTVRVEGSVHGTIRAGKAVVLGKEGVIEGDVVTQDAVIGGRLTGSIVAESRLELQSTSVIQGEIRACAEHLQLDEGARFNGQIKMVEAGDRSASSGSPLPGAPPAAISAPPASEDPRVKR